MIWGQIDIPVKNGIVPVVPAYLTETMIMMAIRAFHKSFLVSATCTEDVVGESKRLGFEIVTRDRQILDVAGVL
ncbi:MAG: hypothetical protein OXH85_00640 [Truepera sp.]|nr:hypothetical protein [Truepera sp.]